MCCCCKIGCRFPEGNKWEYLLSVLKKAPSKSLASGNKPVSRETYSRKDDSDIGSLDFVSSQKNTNRSTIVIFFASLSLLTFLLRALVIVQFGMESLERKNL
jgi:hypothetical protein